MFYSLFKQTFKMSEMNNVFKKYAYFFICIFKFIFKFFDFCD